MNSYQLKKANSKIDTGDLLEGTGTATVMAEPKTNSLKEVFQLQTDSSPIQPNNFWCKSHGCKKKATFADVSEPDDKPVMCKHHASGMAMEGCYKAAAFQATS